MGGCAKKSRAFIFLQHVEPVSEIGGVVAPDLRRDAKIGAQENGGSPGTASVNAALHMIDRKSAKFGADSGRNPLLTPHSGGDEPVKLISSRSRTGSASTLPHICHTDIFEQCETSRREIRFDFRRIESKCPWLAVRSDPRDQPRCAKKLFRMVQDRALDVREEQDTPVVGDRTDHDGCGDPFSAYAR